MRIALATCSTLPTWEIDDLPFHHALAQIGIDAHLVAWDDTSVPWESFDACLIRTTWDYTDRPTEFLEWADRVSTKCVLYNPKNLIRWNLHKSYLKDLENKGIPVVPTEWIDQSSVVDLRTLLKSRGWTRAFLKPAIGATARETLRFTTDDLGLAQAQTHLDRMTTKEDMLLQPYLERVEHDGEISAIFIDGKISHMVRKIPVAGDYRVQDDFGATDEPFEFSTQEMEIAQAAVKAIGEPVLYARTDFLRDQNGKIRLNELEIVEPSMFFRHCPMAPMRLAEALVRRVTSGIQVGRSPRTRE